MTETRVLVSVGPPRATGLVRIAVLWRGKRIAPYLDIWRLHDGAGMHYADLEFTVPEGARIEDLKPFAEVSAGSIWKGKLWLAS